MEKEPFIARPIDAHLDSEYSQWLSVHIGHYHHPQIKAAGRILIAEQHHNYFILT